MLPLALRRSIEAFRNHGRWPFPNAARALGKAIVLALGAAVTFPAGASDLRIGTVAATAQTHSTFLATSGEVTLIRGSSRSAAVPGDALRQDDVLLTGAQGHATVHLQDGTRLALGPHARLEITQFRYDGDARDAALLLSLRRGILEVQPSPLVSRGDRLKVVTPTAVITGRDANFIVDQAP